MKQTQSQPIIPNKAHIIFDNVQAYAAYSLPKIQFQQFNPVQLPLETTVIQLNEQQPIKTIESYHQVNRPISNKDIRLKEWNVNYREDIAKRKVYSNNLQVQSNDEFLQRVKLLQKAIPKKKTKRHKTNFKIPKTKQNQEEIKNVVSDFIKENKKKSHNEIVRVKQYEQTAPFLLETVDFADRLIAEKIQFKEKYGFDEKNLRRNNLILEEVILKRMQRRENARNRNINGLPQLQPISRIKSQRAFSKQSSKQFKRELSAKQNIDIDK